MDDRLKHIRAAEKQSHLETYGTWELFQDGSWLSKPVRAVTDLLPLFEKKRRLRVLDLGCGVGRNAIFVARKFADIDVEIDCVDILDFAIEKLEKNAECYGVERSVKGIVMPLEDYPVPEKHYDFVMAVSALEHVDSEASFVRKLKEIRDGIRPGGAVCMVVNTQVQEENRDTGELLEPQFEVNMSTEAMKNLLTKMFDGWEILKFTVKAQEYEIPRGNVTAKLTTDVVNFVARSAEQ